MASTFRHFTVERLADGVWAVLHRIDPPAPDAWAISNAGIVDLGDRTLVFDALMTTAAATELRGAAEELTGRPPGIVVYSHAHNDHVWGGSRFPEATVVSSTRARTALLAEGLGEVESYRDAVADRLAFWEAAATSDDPLVRHDAPIFLPYWHGIAATVPTLELRIPDLVFEGRLDIHGRDRRVGLVALERGHSTGDVFLILPDEQVAFCGDLLFVDCHPYLGDGDVEGLRDSLRMLEVSGAELFVPGHGSVGRAAAIRTLERYVRHVERTAARTGKAAPAIPGPYRSWAAAAFFAENVEFVARGGRQAEASIEEPSR
jgi:glyoxylase-like metal-dependent hydrolase (beta-lactamase superfamily II)